MLRLMLALAGVSLAAAVQGQCTDGPAAAGTTGAALAASCIACLKKQDAAGCAAPKFCPGITGEPWCGPAATTGCDTGPGTNPGSTTLACCQQYADPAVAEACSGKHECPDKEESDKEYAQLTGAEVTALCGTCFDLGNATGCNSTHFCPEETGFPWCGDATLVCDALGTDHVKGVTAVMGRGCCAKYAAGNTSAACGGLPCPDGEAKDGAKATCEACFGAGKKVGCTQIGFCTKTLYGSVPWCGPSEPKFCSGAQIETVAGCSKLPAT